MFQLAQNPRSGAVELVEVPTPAGGPGLVVVQTLASVVSAGTERNTVKLGSNSLARTALERPDLLQRTVDKVKRDGLRATIEVVRDRTQRLRALGYSSCGRVVDTGEGVENLEPGQIVACAGADFASHAELVAVPQQLAARVPEGLDPQEAAFTTIGAIALQGVRLARIQLGENVAVIGLGLVGQITVQLLAAAGCRVLGVDLDPARVALAHEHGAVESATPEEALAAATRLDGGRGCDAVLVTADSSNNKPLELAAQLARGKGRVVLVGLVGTEVPRHVFYEKELELVVSRSTGPGRYDPSYELEGIDYPFAYVRWTERRNMEAFLDLLHRGRVSVSHLITHRFPFFQASEAYQLLLAGGNSLGMVFHYPTEPVEARPRLELQFTRKHEIPKGLAFGLIGAGRFARSTLLPLLQEQGFQPQAVTSAHGLSARDTAERFRFGSVVTSAEELISQEDLDVVFIAAPHASHASLVCQALQAGKHVFVEKPLAVDRDQLEDVKRAAQASAHLLAVGFNRRFSPFAQKAKEWLEGVPFTFHYRVNAGPMPPDHWLSTRENGGRLVGEVCHFIDLMLFLAGSELESVTAGSGHHSPGRGVEDAHIFLRFADGTAGSISYLTTTGARLTKERLEIWGPNLVIELDDFREAWFYRVGKDRTLRWRRQAKGHREELAAFREALLSGGAPPIPLAEMIRVTEATFEAAETLRRCSSSRQDGA